MTERRIAAHPVVFSVSAGVILTFVIGAIASPKLAQAYFAAVLEVVAGSFGWVYSVSVASFLGFAIWLGFSRFGRIRLGKPDDQPDFSRLTWFSMLFSAGMGIGIVFFGVAEPMMHFASPPTGDGGTAAAADAAMEITFFHWGLHAWAIYVVLGLALAYFHFRKGLPLAVRSALHPLIGERIHGMAGNVVDILAVFGTVFGLATSLGLGAMQINAGLAHLFDVDIAPATQVIIIAVITLAATTSLVTGLRHGIRRLSEINIGLAALLMVFVLAFGPTLALVVAFGENLARYLVNVLPRTFQTSGMSSESWYAAWTLFYWGWWISWAPFVGTFVARISKGRTVRELVVGVLLVPTLATFVWLTAFGDTALTMEQSGQAGIAAAVEENAATAIFEVLGRLPLGTVASAIAALVVALFFVTSSDSGSFVVDMLTSGGNPNPPVWQRIFWAVTEGAVACALLLAGGLKGLQSAAISTGLPFCLVLILVCVSLVKAFRAEGAAEA